MTAQLRPRADRRSIERRDAAPASRRGADPVGQQSTATLNRRWADAVLGALVAAGVERVVISPGSRSTPLVLAAERHPSLSTDVLLDERAAGFAALGMARASGRPVALVCTSGTAAGHYLPAVMEADRSRVPLVVLSADRPRERHRCGAPQTIEQRSLFSSYVRSAVDLGAPQPEVPIRWVSLSVAQTLDAATAARPGPVHVNAAYRKPFWSDASEAESSRFPGAPSVLRGPPALSGQQLAALARQLRGARRGLIVCGLQPESDGARGWPRALTALASALGWPILAEPTSQLRFGPSPRAQVVTSYEAILRAECWATASQPDLLLRFGQAPTSRLLSEWLATRSEAQTILVDGGGEWREPTLAGDALVVADPVWLAEALVRALADHAPAHETVGWAGRWSRVERLAAATLSGHSGQGLWEGAVARKLVESIPEGGLLFVASGMPIRDLEAFAPRVEGPLSVAANRGVNGIDGLVATAFGAALGWRPGPVVGLLGDLALLHDPDGLLAASQWCRQADAAGAEGVDLTLVVLNNGGGGIFEHLPIARHPAFERYFLTPPESVDLRKLCEGMGIPHVEVVQLAALGRLLAQRGAGLRVLEVPIDRDDNRARRLDALNSVRDVIETLESPD